MVDIDFWCLYEKILLLNELQRHQAGCLLLIYKQNGRKTLSSCFQLKMCFKKVKTSKKSLCCNSDRACTRLTLLGNTELRGLDGPFNTRALYFPTESVWYRPYLYNTPIYSKRCPQSVFLCFDSVAL